jgi:predicted nucleotidyltransferase
MMGRRRMIAMAPEAVARRLEDLAIAMPELELLVLFGSTAKSRPAPGDVDLAVRCSGSADLDALYLAIAPRLGTDRLDLVDLRRASPVLAFEVATNGRLLFQRHAGTFVEFQSLAARRFSDTAKLRAAQQRAIHVFLTREGLA